MKEFIKKLIGRLEKLSIPIYDSDGEIENKVVFTDIAKNIVNELAEKYKNTNIITDFLQYARDNADNYDTNEGWSLADLIDLSIKYSEEYKLLEDIESLNNGWIPCSERLPEDGTCVLTCNKSGHIYREIWGGCYTVNHYPATKFGYDSETIIAWQPLPAPYKE